MSSIHEKETPSQYCACCCYHIKKYLTVHWCGISLIVISVLIAWALAIIVYVLTNDIVDTVIVAGCAPPEIALLIMSIYLCVTVIGECIGDCSPNHIKRYLNENRGCISLIVTSVILGWTLAIIAYVLTNNVVTLCLFVLGPFLVATIIMLVYICGASISDCIKNCSAAKKLYDEEHALQNSKNNTEIVDNKL